MGGKGEEEGWEQVNSEVLSRLQPAKKPISNSKIPEVSNWFEKIPIFLRTILSAST